MSFQDASKVAVAEQHLVFRIVYKYTDLELNQVRSETSYVKSVDDIYKWFNDLLLSHHMIEVKNHPQCRMNQEFHITTVLLSHKKYVSLF